MKDERMGLLLVLVFFCLSLSGCYYFSAKREIGNAQVLLDQLKSAGGPMKAPYEYCSAESFLAISKLEFGENDFKHAKGFASRSKAVAQAGLTEVKKK